MPHKNFIIFFLAGLLILVILFGYRKRSEINSLNRSIETLHDEALRANSILSITQKQRDSLVSAMSDIDSTRTRIVYRYRTRFVRDSLRISALDPEGLATAFNTAYPDSVITVNIVGTDSFITGKVSIRTATIMRSQAAAYDSMSQANLTAFEGCKASFNRLDGVYKEVSQELQRAKDTMDIAAEQLKQADKQHRKEIRQAKMRSFVKGSIAGGAVSIILFIFAAK